LAALDVARQPVDVLRCARMLASLAEPTGAWRDVAAVLDKAMRSLDVLYTSQATGMARRTWLMNAKEIHGLAAFALAKTGRPVEAVVVAEKGLARTLGDALTFESLDGAQLIGSGHVQSFERYRMASERLRRLLDVERRGGDASTNDRAIAQLLAEARADVDVAIAAIRALPGHESFGAPLAIDDIQRAAAGGPLVYLVSTESGGLALVVGPAAVTPVWLPSLTEKALHGALSRFAQAQAAWRAAPADDVTFDAWLSVLDDTTRRSWEAVMQHVVPAIGDERTTVLVPTGLLHLVPLHASWTENRGGARGRLYALDTIEWRYAPNARAVLVVRQIAQTSDADSFLAVENPKPVDAEDLPSAAWEVAGALAAFPRSTRLAGTDATRESVLAALSDHRVLHFACHGFADPSDALSGGLVMARDEVVAVRDLLALKLWNPRLAVLSACESGVVGTALPDEVVGLPSALLQAGAAAVIGSLWPVADDSTALLMLRFYDDWRSGGASPPEALRRAQCWIRDADPEGKRRFFTSRMTAPGATAAMLDGAAALDFSHPYYWAPFVYLGA
jgi:CHAT domain